MKKIIPTLFIAILFTSCQPLVSYVGASHAQTENVDVYVDPSAIGRSYSVIGKGYLTRPVGPYGSYEKMQRSAIEQARKHGADAVLISDRVYISTQTGISTVKHRDTMGSRSSTSIVTGPALHNEPEIQFLKYEK